MRRQVNAPFSSRKKKRICIGKGGIEPPITFICNTAVAIGGYILQLLSNTPLVMGYGPTSILYPRSHLAKEG
jgi:hypothetical protein